MKRKFKYPQMDIELLEDWDILCKSQDGWGDAPGGDIEGSSEVNIGGADGGGGGGDNGDGIDLGSMLP